MLAGQYLDVIIAFCHDCLPPPTPDIRVLLLYFPPVLLLLARQFLLIYRPLPMMTRRLLRSSLVVSPVSHLPGASKAVPHCRCSSCALDDWQYLFSYANACTPQVYSHACPCNAACAFGYSATHSHAAAVWLDDERRPHFSVVQWHNVHQNGGECAALVPFLLPVCLLPCLHQGRAFGFGPGCCYQC